MFFENFFEKYAKKTLTKGEILRSVAPLLLEKGYDVKVFNLIEPENSDGYNPFVYIRKDEDVE